MKYRPVIDYQLFTDEQIRVITGSCGGVDSEVLRLGLDGVAEQFIYDHYNQQLFPRANLEKRLKDIESSAGRLLRALYMDDSFELESILTDHLCGNLKLLKEQIELLKKSAHDASCEQTRQKTKTMKRHSGDDAFKTLFEGMSRIYTENFWIIRSFTTNEGGADGTTTTFILLVLDCIKENLSSTVKASDPDIVLSLEKSPEAIRALWRRVKSSSNLF
jgi:hypothetical protein